MFMHRRAAILVISFVMFVVMLRALMPPIVLRAVVFSVMPRAVVTPVVSWSVMSAVVSGLYVFSVVVAVPKVMLPVFFVMDVTSACLALIAITVAISCQCRPCAQKSQCNQNYE